MKGPEATTGKAKKRKPSTTSALRIATQKKRMIKAMEKHLCIVTYAAKTAGIDRGTHYDWMKEDPAYAAAINALVDLPIDMAENSLAEQIRNKNTIATIFYLKCKAKQRGFIEKPEGGHEHDPEKLQAALAAIADGLKVQ